MHIVVAFNLWGDIVLNIFFQLFWRICDYKKAKLVPISSLRLLKYIFSILCLGLVLKKYLKINLSKKTKTAISPLQPTQLMFSSIFLLIVAPNLL